jgi:hypothetical protein
VILDLDLQGYEALLESTYPDLKLEFLNLAPEHFNLKKLSKILRIDQDLFGSHLRSRSCFKTLRKVKSRTVTNSLGTTTLILCY